MYYSRKYCVEGIHQRAEAGADAGAGIHAVGRVGEAEAGIRVRKADGAARAGVAEGARAGSHGEVPWQAERESEAHSPRMSEQVLPAIPLFRGGFRQHIRTQQAPAV